jgi:starch synthase
MAVAQKPRLLLIAQDMTPYSDISEVMSRLTEQIPHAAQSGGMEVRILMPKFGVINERRHRLHEVVRLSGMNIIVDDDDYPLIIKVASLPGSRMQVYFLDNDEFFKRKEPFEDANGKAFDDNADRMVFFCKGAIEIVKKFGWAPDVVHCHGWMTSLIPFYLKTAYKNEPLFRDTKVVTSLYDEHYDQFFGERFQQKASINHLTEKDLAIFNHAGKTNLRAGIYKYCDGIIMGDEATNAEIQLDTLPKRLKTLAHNADEFEAVAEAVSFYKTVLGIKEKVKVTPATETLD